MEDKESSQAPPLTEVEQLRARVKALEQAEFDRLVQLVNQLTIERDHYKGEAYRNAEIGRQIGAQAQEQITDLKNQIINIKETYARRSPR